MKAVGLHKYLPIDHPESLLDLDLPRPEAAGLLEAAVLRTTLKQNLGAISAGNLKRAHRLLEEGHVIGKIVLEGF